MAFESSYPGFRNFALHFITSSNFGTGGIPYIMSPRSCIIKDKHMANAPDLGVVVR
jgi:hypothetical protein